jgi:ATP-dependent RNA helicase DeaD
MPFPLLHPALQRALSDQGYSEPTPVQEAVLAAEPGRDLLVSAQTGSGKTVAFGLAAGAELLGEAEAFGEAGAPLALVIAPTRELAQQVQRELTWLYGPARARVCACVGGMDPRREQRALAAGCHIVVGTPGRLRDHLERGALDISTLRIVVLDEADEMLDLGFREDLEFILDAAPTERRSLLFSATLAKEITGLARRYQRDALRIDTTTRSQPHGDIEYRAVRVAPNDVEHAVVNVLRYFESPGALVFCATREGVRRLHGKLVERGFSAVALSGELSQNERSHALQALRDGRARVCVATDVAARGLDLPDLGLVIHADLPTNRAGLLHRSGRTGRAGRKGVSVLVVPYTRRRQAETLLGHTHADVAWGGAPTADEIRVRDQERLMADPIFSEEPAEEDQALAALLLARRTPEELATALARLHRQSMPAPETLFEEPAFQPREAKGRDRAERGDRPERVSDGVWFRITVGRTKNADPKWLIPLICRLGHVTKRDIGAIRIFARESRFEIARESADRFAAAVRNASEDDTRIEPSEAPPATDAQSKPKPYLKRKGPGGPGGRPRPRKPN